MAPFIAYLFLNSVAVHVANPVYNRRKNKKNLRICKNNSNFKLLKIRDYTARPMLIFLILNDNP